MLTAGTEFTQQSECYVFRTLVEVQVREADRAVVDVAFRDIQQRFRAINRD